MKPEEWKKVKSIMDECLDLGSDERQFVLDTRCAGDPGLRAEVESLLESYSEAEGEFLEKSIFDRPAESWTGRQLGLYQIGEIIDEGGMGTVYRAVRASDFKKQVAIKLVKRGMDTDFLLKRFRQERQILAALDHPNIARLLDGGATDDGLPYLVMEYVEGTPIVEYSEKHALPQRDRLTLFRDVCSAVQFAHQNLVVHRDLKPGNILVTANGTPKLLDFGIAKLMEPDAATTMTSIRMLSPECASPEQVKGQPITTASDIYSLGVLLYILLTGQPPYRFETRDFAEIIHVVSKAEPKKPSEMRPVHTDLDNITLKAMHKDPARRYASAEQLSEDIRRHLEGLPVVARNDTLSYRAAKFIGRHTAATVAASLAVLSLIGGMAGTLWQAHRSNVQQQITGAVNDFLRNDVLAQASANRQASRDIRPDPDLKVRTALDRAAARIEGKFAAQPAVEASIRQTIGEAYEDLGLYPEAQRHIERAVDLRRRTLGEKDSSTLTSLSTLAALLDEQGKWGEAAALGSEVLILRRGELGETNPDTLASMDQLAIAYKHLGKYAQAEPLVSKALDLRRQVLGEENPKTLESMNDLATIYEDQNKFAQAEPLLVKANDIRRRVLGDEHPDTLTGLNNLSVAYAHQGQYKKAAELQSKVLELRRRVLGPEHLLTLASLNNLAAWEMQDGNYAQAEALFTSLLSTRRRILGPDHPDTLLSMNNLGLLYRRQGRYADAEPLFRGALEIETRVLGGEDNRYRLITMYNLALTCEAEHKYAQAEPLLLAVLTARRRTLGPENPDTLLTLRSLARFYVDTANFVQAETNARAALAIYEKQNSAVWDRYYTQSLLGESLAGQRKYSDARPLLEGGCQGMMTSAPAADRAALEDARRWLAQLPK